MAKNEVEVIESIKKIDSKLIKLWSKTDILEEERNEALQDIEKLNDKKLELMQEKERIIEENYKLVLLNDSRAVTKAIDEFRNICNEYSSLNTIGNHLYDLQLEINEKLKKLEKEVPDNVEEPVKVEVN